MVRAMKDAPKHAPMPAPPAVTGDGFTVRSCRGLIPHGNGCHHAAVVPDDPAGLAGEVALALERLDLGAGLRRLHGRPLKHHEAFTVSISCCPNACSRPQITDAGFIGASRPRLDPAACTACGACLETCRERALIHGPRGNIKDIDGLSCVACGACVRVCPSGALSTVATGFRVQAGGRLGRHPRLAEDLSGPLHSGLVEPGRVPAAAVALARLLLNQGRPDERLADLLERLPKGTARKAVAAALPDAP